MGYCLLCPFHKFVLKSHQSLHFMLCELINSPEDAQQSGKEGRSVPSQGQSCFKRPIFDSLPF